MTVSVCMSLYNGERFVEKQLQSILEQTRQPDQVILCDDGSKDRTPEIVQRFIARNHLEDRWIFAVNEQNLGYPLCFYHVMDLCTGDIVFLSDQDDVWNPYKIQAMLSVFAQKPDARVVCCKYDLIDADGKKINRQEKHKCGDKRPDMGEDELGSASMIALRHITPKDVFYKIEWPGMVLAYRRDWYVSWSRGSYQIPHDILICARAAEENGFFQMDACLASHRRHDNNVGREEHSIKKRLNRERKLGEIEIYLENLRQFGAFHVMQTDAGKVALRNKYRSMKGRYEALQSRSIGKVIQNAWKNRRETRLATVVCDVIIATQR